MSNRIQQIRKSTSPEQWCYIASNLNPADLATRAVEAEKLSESAWLQGPSFLLDVLDNTTQQVPQLLIMESDPEVRALAPNM